MLLFVAGLSAVGALACAWVRAEIRSEDTWAATADALADDPDVRAAVADLIAAQVIAVTGADDLISGVLPGPLGGLADPITEQATGLISSATEQLVGTEAFRTAWEAAVRASHAELLAALDGDGRFTELTSEGVVLDLGSTVEQLQLLLDERGFALLDVIDVSGIDIQIPLVDAPGVQSLKDLLDALDTAVVVLPVIAVVALVLGMVVARRRSLAVLAGGLGVVAGAALMWVLLEEGRAQADDRVSGGVLGPGVVRVVADEVVANSSGPMLAVAAVGMAITALGVVGAVATRRRA